MAGKVYITEYGDVRAAMAFEPPITTQTITTGGTSTQSSAFNANTKLIRVHAATIVSALVGTNPTADTNSPRFAAGQTEYFHLPTNGSQYKIAAIDNT